MKPRAGKYSSNAIKVSQAVWAVPGGKCGKYLAKSMPFLLDAWGSRGNSCRAGDASGTRSGLNSERGAVSAATIDRIYGNKVQGCPPRSLQDSTVTTVALHHPDPIAGDEVEAAPGFFEVDTLAHCAPSLKGEFLRSLYMTDMFTGWVHAHSAGSSTHILKRHAVEMIPFEIRDGFG